MKIFISYSKTKEAVDTLRDDLQQMGHEAWYDEDLAHMGGQSWWGEILERIRACQLFVFAVSPQALASEACERELQYAADLNKPILPVIVAAGVDMELTPTVLQQIQGVQYSKPDKTSFVALLQSINGIQPAEAWNDPKTPIPPDIPFSPLALARDKIMQDTLTSDEQVILFHELKELAQRAGYSERARKLLRELQNHRDLRASVYRDIEDFLSGVATMGDTMQSIPVTVNAKPSQPDIEEDQRIASSIANTTVTDTATLYVEAFRGFTGATNRFRILLDDDVIGGVNMLNDLSTTIDAGQHTIKCIALDIIVKVGESNSITFNAVSGQRYGFRIRYTGNVINRQLTIEAIDD